jgi:hypothetical protein
MVNQRLFTQLLKFSLEFYVLIHEHFSWNTTFTQDSIPKCISKPLTIFVSRWCQFNSTMKKCGDLQLALQLGFGVAMTICKSFATHSNSTYFYECQCYWTSVRCNECNSSYVKPYTYATYATQLQLRKNNYYVTIMQLSWVMSCWCHFSLIYQNLTCYTIAIFGWKLLFLKYWSPPSIMSVHL